MALDVSGLANYTKTNETELLTKAVFGAKTISLMTPMTDIKSSKQINLLDTDAVFQTGGTCGFSASGTTIITNRNVTVGKIKVHEALCPKTLEAKYTQLRLSAGSQYDSFVFEKEYSELKAKLIAKQLETAIWQGDLTSGNALLNKFDGLLVLGGYVRTAVTGQNNVNAISGIGTVSTAVATAIVTGVGTSFVTQGIAAGDKVVVNGNTGIVLTVDSATQITLTANFGFLNSAKTFSFVPTTSSNFTTPYTTFTVSNAIAIMQSVANTIPVEILMQDDVRVFIGMDLYRIWATALTTANMFNYTAEAGKDSYELVIPGTNIRVVAVNGLNGTNRIISSPLSNMFYGTDLVGEEDRFKIFFAQEADEVRYMAEFKAGCNYAFLNQVTQFTLAV